MLILNLKPSLAEEVLIKHFDVEKIEITSKKEEGFFLVQKSNVWLDVDTSNLKKYEKFLGSTSKKRDSPIDWIPIKNFPEFRIIEGQEITYSDSSSQKIEKYRIEQKIKVQLIGEESEIGQYYDRFTLLLTSYSDSTGLSHMDKGWYDSVAYMGKSFVFNPSKKILPSMKEITSTSGQISILEKDFRSKTKENLTSEEIFKTLTEVKGTSIYKLISSKTNKTMTYAQLNDGSFISWIGTKVESFGKDVDGSELTAVMNVDRQRYYLIFFKDRVEKYYVGEI